MTEVMKVALHCPKTVVHSCTGLTHLLTCKLKHSMAMLNFIYVLTGTDMQAKKELKGNSSLMPIMVT
jgi:hypothetical protein